MAKRLELVNGIPKMVSDPLSPTIYDETIEILASGASGENELNGPITAGTTITLPASKTYTGDELEVYWQGDRMTGVFDYNTLSSTTISFTFQLEVGDKIRFRIDRGA